MTVAATANDHSLLDLAVDRVVSLGLAAMLGMLGHLFINAGATDGSVEDATCHRRVACVAFWSG
jgi:hypothetical protein